jgi:putative ABC transport system ATP-binding protein
MDASRLRALDLFGGLSDEQLEQVAGWSEEVEVDVGEYLIRRDGFGHEFFVILEGTAEAMDGDTHLADMVPGEFFGELALVDQARRSASVRATTPMRLAVMSRQQFLSMVEAMPPVEQRVRAKITERLEASEFSKG